MTKRTVIPVNEPKPPKGGGTYVVTDAGALEQVSAGAKVPKPPEPEPQPEPKRARKA